VSLNPLQLVKAFRAPLLEGASSNADRSQLAAQAGHSQGKSGAAVMEINAEVVGKRPPKQLTCFSTSSNDTDDTLRVL
jgi:hypothetical protein